ncbi:hypothetical protein B5M09_001689 [Aphanomyces astaci]|uniref:Uncharacterized protein n=1 Tax=Aphanomyces astaci TaxID=112090 RepID=A0A425CTR9_APHAT|nr:hypothetical protein B5M09_001689 [Aphanomyces astaci]
MHSRLPSLQCHFRVAVMKTSSGLVLLVSLVLLCFASVVDADCNSCVYNGECSTAYRGTPGTGAALGAAAGVVTGVAIGEAMHHHDGGGYDGGYNNTTFAGDTGDNTFAGDSGDNGGGDFGGDF